jgi:hypothetical protein
MKWAIVILLAALTATIAINAVLLGHIGTSTDPVGQLSPTSYVPPTTYPPQPAHSSRRIAVSQYTDD